MHHIFYLMGKSASGKDTIYQKLLEHDTLGLAHIVLYTTRPIREGEAEGREYYFTDEIPKTFKGSLLRKQIKSIIMEKIEGGK